MTYSIIARDAATAELGIAVQSRYFGAASIVPHVQPGEGIVAAQAFVDPSYGRRVLEMLRSGLEPQRVVDQLVNSDPGQAMRQVAIIDAQGRMAVHTGAQCVAAAGHALGAQCCAQANMMARASVWGAMVRAFERTAGDIAERLVAAMRAAENEGGDLRGRQSAVLLVASGAGRAIDLRVDDDADPVGEIARLLALARAHARARGATDKALADDAAAALADLDACCAAYPDEPEFLVRRALVLLLAGRAHEARAALARAHAVHPGWTEFVLRLADARIIPVSRSSLEPLLAGLSSAAR